jgi:hypothetical protein
MTTFRKAVLGALLVAGTQLAAASTFTNTSPTGADVTTIGVSTVGGIVVQLVGTNGTTITSQLAASTLYVGFAANNPFTIGTQAGFDDSITSLLGGGLSRATFRFSLFDGDTGAGNFDFNQNFLQVNGVEVGNWTSVQAQNTDGLGVALASGFSGGGFRDNLLDTGWFDVTNNAMLASIFTNIDAANSISFQLRDIDPNDNFFDFTRGINNSLINVGSGPIVTPPNRVSEPGALALAGLGLLGVAFMRRRKGA